MSQRFTEEFEIQVVKQVTEHGYSQVNKGQACREYRLIYNTCD